MSETPSNDTDVPETLQSLLVAFTLALAFRGFVVEGFVIPTGSMAPTLMGQHVRFKTPDTGYEYAFDSSSARIPLRARPQELLVGDPMVSQSQAIGGVPDRAPRRAVVWRGGPGRPAQTAAGTRLALKSPTRATSRRRAFIQETTP